MKKYSKKHQAGFTLIEISIAMVIIGLMVAGLLQLYSTYIQQKAITTTSDNIKAAQTALQKFQDDHGFYPCPADPTDPSLRATDCNQPAPPGIKVVTGSAGRNVRIGVMPILDTNGETKLISGSQAVDGWRNRLTYAVTESMALDATKFLAGNGAISIANAAGAVQITTSNIVVLSHGEDGAGAYTTAGVRLACNNDTKDTENCNDDAIFMSDKRSFGMNTAYNDDYIDYTTATAVETTKACEKGQVLIGLKSNGDLICSNNLKCPQNQAMVGILPDGVNADCQLVTSSCGHNEAMVSLTLGSAPVCVRNMPGDCPVGYVQNGTVTSEGPDFGKPNCLEILTSCPSGYVQVGTQANHQPICVPNFNTKCSGGMVQVGNNADGSADCRSLSCPAGQYFYGMYNGTPLCSGDRRTADGNCPAGQSVTGINGDTVTCGVVNTGPGNCTVWLNPWVDWYHDAFGVARTHPTTVPGTGTRNAGGSWITARTRWKPDRVHSLSAACHYHYSFGWYSADDCYAYDATLANNTDYQITFDTVTNEWMCVAAGNGRAPAPTPSGPSGPSQEGGGGEGGGGGNGGGGAGGGY